MTRSKGNAVLSRQLTALHRDLGIPATYAAERRLSPHVEAEEADLVEVAISEEGRPIRLIRAAAEAWGLMRLAAMRDDIELFAMSGFRSIERQAEILRNKMATGEPLESLLNHVAAPGFSEHHTGRALDIGTPEHTELDEGFAETAAFQWLEKNAAAYGFTLSYPKSNPHGITYEPWHWCWSDHTGIRS